jgi:hypothetical protein
MTYRELPAFGRHETTELSRVRDLLHGLDGLVEIRAPGALGRGIHESDPLLHTRSNHLAMKLVLTEDLARVNYRFGVFEFESGSGELRG